MFPYQQKRGNAPDQCRSAAFWQGIALGANVAATDILASAVGDERFAPERGDSLKTKLSKHIAAATMVDRELFDPLSKSLQELLV